MVGTMGPRYHESLPHILRDIVDETNTITISMWKQEDQAFPFHRN